jgi:NAD(P)-dependent dehydrogenase (short-subunit alcohol dehydrogenase family)
MAKAALNMLTRTSAAEYAQCGIYMNSVDTGWVSNENPYGQQVKQREKKGILPAARCAGRYGPVIRSDCSGN